MSSETLSIRVPAETKRWLERFSRSRGSLSSAASRLIEEARRREQFRFVDYRDSSLGRLAYVQASRVPVYFAWMTGRDFDFDAEKLAEHYQWSLAKAESVLGYAESFSEEIAQNVADHEELSEYQTLKQILPTLQKNEAGT